MRPSPGANGKLTKGDIQRRDLEREAKATANRLKLLETQLWSDNDRLTGLTEAVVECLRDTEHAQARLQRLKDAHAADDLARSHARARAPEPAPAAGGGDVCTCPRRRQQPPPDLENRRATLRHRGGVRTRGAGDGAQPSHDRRVLGAGGGGAGHGLEALTAALHGHASSFPAIGSAAAARTGWKSLTAASRRSRRSGRHEPADPPSTGRRWRRRGGTSTRLVGTWPSCTSGCRGPRLRTSPS